MYYIIIYMHIIYDRYSNTMMCAKYIIIILTKTILRILVFIMFTGQQARTV